jgi:DNA-binding response OmpR family regulator
MRVVLINDKCDERDAMVRVLQQASCTVEPFDGANGAMAAIGRESPHVIVLAIPGSGFLELIRRIRGADAPGTAYFLAVLDATAGGREIPAILDAGVHDFLRRPWLDLELVARVKAPTRLIQWARSAGKRIALDFSTAVDVGRLRVWQDMGAVIAEDLSQVLRQPLEMSKGWPRRFGPGVRGATIAMSLASDRTEVRVSIVIDPPTGTWLGATVLGDPKAAEATIDDVLREFANIAGGAVKRAALPESVTLTTGLPINDNAPRCQGDGVQCWTATADGGKACIAIVGEIRKRENQRVSASRLREGMVVVNDLRTESGALLVTAGSRLTSTTATRIAQMLGERFFVEVAYAA